MIQLPAVWLSLGVLGKKFAILARRYNAITLNDMLYGRYQSRLLVWLASLSLLVAFLGAMTVQFIGGARLLETAAGIPYDTGLLIFGISIALYTAFGGFRASVLNDAMQGLVMLLGTVLLLVAVIHAAGGLDSAVHKLQQIDPALVSPQGGDQILSLPFMASFWIPVCFGVIGLPHTAVRCISYKDSKAVHRGILLGTVVVAVLMFGMHGRRTRPRGVAGSQDPRSGDPDADDHRAAAVRRRDLLAAPMAAIMSTINAQLLQSSATIIKDLYGRAAAADPQRAVDQALLQPDHADPGLLVLLAARRPPEMIIWLNLLAFGGLEAVFLWPLVLGLYWERANAQERLAQWCRVRYAIRYWPASTCSRRGCTLSCLRCCSACWRFISVTSSAKSAGRRHHYPLEENCYALDPTQTEHHRQPGGRPERRAGGKRRRVGDLPDTHDNPVFEPLPGETLLWGDTDVIGLYDAETDMAEVVAMLEQHPLLGAGFRHKIEQLEDKDWEREWMDNFHPMRFGERLWICPSWRDVPDPDAVNVMLDPGGVRHRYPPDHGAVPAVAGRPRSGRQNRYRLRLRFRHPGNRRPEAGCSARYRHRYRSPCHSGQPRQRAA